MPYIPTRRFIDQPSDTPGPGKYDPTSYHFMTPRNKQSKPFGFGKGGRQSLANKHMTGKLITIQS